MNANDFLLPASIYGLQDKTTLTYRILRHVYLDTFTLYSKTHPHNYTVYLRD